MNKAGSFVVVWADLDEISGIFGQLFGPNCTKIGDNFLIGLTPNQNWAYLHVDITETGDFIVVWRHNPSDFDQSWVKRFHSTGQPLDSTAEISPLWHGKGPCVKYLNEDYYVLSITTWNRDGYYHGVFSQIYRSNGEPASRDVQVNSYFMHDQEYSEIAKLSDGSFFIVWQSFGVDGDGDGISGQYFTFSGAKIGGELKINTQTANPQIFPAIGVTSDDNILVAWLSFTEGNTGFFAQRFRIAEGSSLTADSISPILAVEIVKETQELVPIDMVISDDEIYIYLIDIDGNIQVYDRTSGQDYLTVNQKYKMFANGHICCIAKYQNHLYIADRASSLFVVRINKNQWNLTLVNTIEIETNVKSIFIDKQTYQKIIISGKYGLESYDILHNPESPTKQGNLSDLKNIKTFLVFKDTVFLIQERQSDLLILNLTKNTIIKINLGVFGYCLDITNDGSFLFIGTSVGIKILDLATTFIISNVQMQSVFSLKLSLDNTLMTVCNEMFHLLYDVRDIKFLNLIQNKTFTKILRYSQISRENTHIFLLSDQAYFLKILTPIFENIVPSLKHLGKIYLKQTIISSLALSSDGMTAFISTYEGNIFLIDIHNLNGSSYKIQKAGPSIANIINIIDNLYFKSNIIIQLANSRFKFD